MFKAIIFILCIIYTTAIFFLPNFWLVLASFMINLIFMVACHVKIKWFFRNILKVLPFVALTAIFNFLLDEPIRAVLITLKLLLVCQITLTYASTVSVNEVAGIISRLCCPLCFFGIPPSDVKIIIVISLSILPLLKRDLKELRCAAYAKNLPQNLTSYRLLITRFLEITFDRMSQIEASLASKA